MKGFIRTAYPLTESQLARLTAVFSSKLHTPIDFQVEQAPELLCGLEVTIGGRIYGSAHRCHAVDDYVTRMVKSYGKQ